MRPTKGDSITIGKKAGDTSIFFIKDTGIGIPPDRLSSLFKNVSERAGTHPEKAHREGQHEKSIPDFFSALLCSHIEV